MRKLIAAAMLAGAALPGAAAAQTWNHGQPSDNGDPRHIPGGRPAHERPGGAQQAQPAPPAQAPQRQFQQPAQQAQGGFQARPEDNRGGWQGRGSWQGRGAWQGRGDPNAGGFGERGQGFSGARPHPLAAPPVSLPQGRPDPSAFDAQRSGFVGRGYGPGDGARYNGQYRSEGGVRVWEGRRAQAYGDQNRPGGWQDRRPVQDYGHQEGYGYRPEYGREQAAGGEWRRDWRRDRRYDWGGWRENHYELFRLPRYYAPRGWDYGYRRFTIGVTLDEALFGENYWIDDPWTFRLPPAYGPYRWVRYYNDALLVDLDTGEVVDTVYGIFY